MIKQNKILKILLKGIIILIAVLFMYPLLMVIINSFKTDAQIMLDAFGLPKKIVISNYSRAWELMGFPQAFLNTLLLTAGGIGGLVFFSSMAGYKLSRTNTRYSTFLFYLCIAPMLIAFSSIMITLIKMAKMLHLMNSIWGLIVIYWGLLMPMSVFLYHGFLKTVPRELDESAYIDGCSTFRAFFSVIFPLLKNITITIIVLNSLAIWNDFLLPLLTIAGKDSTKTLQLAAYKFVGLYTTEYSLLLAGFFMAVLPIIIFFLFMQKYIIDGVITGSVKG